MNENRKEGGEPGKIYHVRNVIGRENLMTCGHKNELAHAVWTEGAYSHSVAIAFIWRPRQHNATLPRSTESYSERTQTHTFENHANLLTYLQTDHCSPRRMALKALLNAKAALS